MWIKVNVWMQIDYLEMKMASGNLDLPVVIGTSTAVSVEFW